MFRMVCRTVTMQPSTTAKRLQYSNSAPAVHKHLRELLRETAQPVAVVTSLMPKEHLSGSHSSFHGATLSSFSSIAMEPHPLVAFSIRIPSRMATSLKTAHLDVPSHLVINILSANQANVAVHFSRPDLHPHPFTSISHTLTHEGLPIIQGSLGGLSCRLVATSWPLHDLGGLKTGQRSDDSVWQGDGVASELFIAEVTRVESVGGVEGDDESLRTLPLLYHRRAYATTQPIAPIPGSHAKGKQG